MPGSKIESIQRVNLPIEGLEIEVLDVNGYRITSGPDSNLVSSKDEISNIFIVIGLYLIL